MHKLILTALLLTITCGIAQAQNNLRFVDSVRFSSAITTEPSYFLSYGLSPWNTDEIDELIPSEEDHERERILPPPNSFFVLFEQGVQGPLHNKDLRAIPDSVRSMQSNAFLLTYHIFIQRVASEEVTISIPQGLRAGVDSIQFRDALSDSIPRIFSYTFKEGSGPVVIPNSFLNHIRMVVHYDASRIPRVTLNVRENRSLETLRLYPNPARSGQSIMLRSELPAGATLSVSDLMGSHIGERRIAEQGAAARLDLNGVPAGTYFVTVHGRNGELVARERIVVLP